MHLHNPLIVHFPSLCFNLHTFKRLNNREASTAVHKPLIGHMPPLCFYLQTFKKLHNMLNLFFCAFPYNCTTGRLPRLCTIRLLHTCHHCVFIWTLLKDCTTGTFPQLCTICLLHTCHHCALCSIHLHMLLCRCLHLDEYKSGILASPLLLLIGCVCKICPKSVSGFAVYGLMLSVACWLSCVCLLDARDIQMKVMPQDILSYLYAL